VKTFALIHFSPFRISPGFYNKSKDNTGQQDWRVGGREESGGNSQLNFEEWVEGGL